jgi:MoaA/NifB/PqqE/SkfB family radical SAM enzyme
VSSEQARQDYQDTTDRILTLIEMPDLDPVTFLDFERRSPYSGRISAPYRLDCALTYRLPANVDEELAPEERVARELTTEEWFIVMDKAWQAGIPHLVFTGGEPTLRADLPELITHAESNGQVTGLLTDGLRFADSQYLNTLLMTGLDHILMLYQAEIENFWQALDNVTAADIFTAIHLTLTSESLPQSHELLKTLSGHGVKSISLSAVDPTLSDGLNQLADLAASLHLSLVWDLPVPYSRLNPVSLEVRSTRLAEGAGRAWLYVEPDGDILPAQGADNRLGNMLSDPWETIWKPN